ncbi:MAG: ATP-grasp domain-containing protein [Vicinamibacterales bacterium]
MKSLRVLALVHKHLVPPEDTTGVDVINAEWKMEFDVMSTLRERGHEVHAVGIHDDLRAIRQSADEFKPHILFNLLEAFDNVETFDQNVVSHIELLRLPYTGCNPRGLTLARDKSLSKQLLAYHRIPAPDFVVIKRGRKPIVPKRLRYPLIVKSLLYEASFGISQASVVENEAQLSKRVQFVHDSIGTAAIIEEFIDGRELYVGVIGNERLRVFPVWEMFFTRMPEHGRLIATERVKWSTKYQEKHGIRTDQADLADDMARRIRHLAKRVYRALDLSGYARIDMRLDGEGRPYVLEANPNPQLAYGEDFAESAERVGISYEALLERIMALGLRWQPERRG